MHGEAGNLAQSDAVGPRPMPHHTPVLYARAEPVPSQTKPVPEVQHHQLALQGATPLVLSRHSSPAASRRPTATAATAEALREALRQVARSSASPPRALLCLERGDAVAAGPTVPRSPPPAPARPGQTLALTHAPAPGSNNDASQDRGAAAGSYAVTAHAASVHRGATDAPAAMHNAAAREGSRRGTAVHASSALGGLAPTDDAAAAQPPGLADSISPARAAAVAFFAEVAAAQGDGPAPALADADFIALSAQHGAGTQARLNDSERWRSIRAATKRRLQQYSAKSEEASAAAKPRGVPQSTKTLRAISRQEFRLAHGLEPASPSSSPPRNSAGGSPPAAPSALPSARSSMQVLSHAASAGHAVGDVARTSFAGASAVSGAACCGTLSVTPPNAIQPILDYDDASKIAGTAPTPALGPHRGGRAPVAMTGSTAVPRTLSLGRHDFGTLPLPKDSRVSTFDASPAGGPAEEAGSDRPSAYAAFTLEQLASPTAARSATEEPADQHTAAIAASAGGSAPGRFPEAPHQPERERPSATDEEFVRAPDDMVQQLQRDLEDAKTRLRAQGQHKSPPKGNTTEPT
jgi:hypothetical protein